MSKKPVPTKKETEKPWHKFTKAEWNAAVALACKHGRVRKESDVPDPASRVSDSAHE